MSGPVPEAQLLDFLREAAVETPGEELCWNYFVGRAMFRAWRAQYGDGNLAENDRVKQLELENAHLKKALDRANGHLQRLHTKKVPRGASSSAYQKHRLFPPGRRGVRHERLGRCG